MRTMAIIEIMITLILIITIRIKTSYGDNVYTNEIKSVRDREYTSEDNKNIISIVSLVLR